MSQKQFKGCFVVGFQTILKNHQFESFRQCLIRIFFHKLVFLRSRFFKISDQFLFPFFVQLKKKIALELSLQ